MPLPHFADLEVLIAVAQAANLREAARALDISQPALSVRLRKLEAKLHFPVFQIQGRRKRLNPKILPFVESAGRVRTELERDWKRVNESQLAAEDLECRVAGRREILLKVATALPFAGRMSLQSTDSRRAIEDLEAGRVDFAISHYRPASHELVARKLFEDELVLVQPRAWKNATDAQLAARPVAILRGQEPTLALWAAAAPKPAPDPAPTPRFVADDWSLVAALVNARRAWTIAPSSIGFREDDVSRRTLSLKLASNAFYVLARRERLERKEYRELFRAFGK